MLGILGSAVTFVRHNTCGIAMSPNSSHRTRRSSKLKREKNIESVGGLMTSRLFADGHQVTVRAEIPCAADIAGDASSFTFILLTCSS